MLITNQLEISTGISNMIESEKYKAEQKNSEIK